MLINLFQTVRSSGVPCTLRELLDLLGALEKQLDQAIERQTQINTKVDVNLQYLKKKSGNLFMISSLKNLKSTNMPVKQVILLRFLML